MFVRIAGLTIEIKNKFPYTEELCKDFIIEPQTPSFTVEVTQEDMERALSENPEFSNEYIESLEIYRIICRKILDYNALLMHCAAICVDNQAYLFTAVSGTGKTTHISLWMKKFGERAFIVNGDKPILRIKDDKFYVCGTPWKGKENYGTNAIIPIKAICILERDVFNHIKRIEPFEAIPTVLTQTLRTNDPVETEKMLTLADKLISSVPFYRLGCNMDPEACEVSYNAMSK